ncbi:PspC domain-containing protein [Pseudomonadales bacterium]|nr:PspC domain-containing protein [Pseudomonadales bacterium]MDB9942897.1 PspC domain-containing protein [Pseudomonadales bacterium]
MNSSDKELQDAQSAARRARRLAERAEIRARRKAQNAEEAAERAARLAQRVRPKQNASDRERNDTVDEPELANRESRADAGYARRSQNHKSRRRSARHRRPTLLSRFNADKTLYRDKKRGKVFGVCAGLAEYLDVKTWQVRLFSLLGLLFVPSLTLPVYFILYFLMENKPYYREVADRFEAEGFDHYADEFDADEAWADDDGFEAAAAGSRAGKPPRYSRDGRHTSAGSRQRSNAQVLRLAKNRFSDIEQRVRAMESHVTSSQFELQRELKKIAGDDL